MLCYIENLVSFFRDYLSSHTFLQLNLLVLARLLPCFRQGQAYRINPWNQENSAQPRGVRVNIEAVPLGGFGNKGPPCPKQDAALVTEKLGGEDRR